jgi:hypothetical protein
MAEGAEPADAEPVASCFGIFGGGKKSAIIATQQETIRRLSANKAQLDKVPDEVIAHGKAVENERNRLISKIESYESQMKEMNEQASMTLEIIAYERAEKEAAERQTSELKNQFAKAQVELMIEASELKKTNEKLKNDLVEHADLSEVKLEAMAKDKTRLEKENVAQQAIVDDAAVSMRAREAEVGRYKKNAEAEKYAFESCIRDFKELKQKTRDDELVFRRD